MLERTNEILRQRVGKPLDIFARENFKIKMRGLCLPLYILNLWVQSS
jgi:hypothetical protein